MTTSGKEKKDLTNPYNRIIINKMENGIIIFLAALLVVREWQHQRDRRDLLDRIMCADYREFKRYEKKPAAPAGNVYMTDEQLAKAEKEKAAGGR
jgi:hypothetical protein